MNTNNSAKHPNNANNLQNKALLKYKTDFIKENHMINTQKNQVNSNNLEKHEINFGHIKANNKSINFKNNLSANKQILTTSNFNSDKNVNLSNTHDLTRPFSGNKIKRNDISNVSILSPKTQKEILNNRVNNANFNENLFQKNINLNINNNTFDTSGQGIKNLKINTNFTPKDNPNIGHNTNYLLNHENSLFPNTTKYSNNQEFFTANNSSNNQFIKNSNLQTKNTPMNNNNNNFNNSNVTNHPSQNSILNNYNNLSKKLTSKSKFPGNASCNPISGNISVGNNNTTNNNSSNCPSNKNTKENFSTNKVSKRINNNNLTSSINFNQTNISLNKTLNNINNNNTNNSNIINRNGNSSPFKKETNLSSNLNENKINLALNGKNVELDLNQFNSTCKNSRNKSNNHNYNSTNINITNQSTIKNNMNNLYSTNFIDVNNNNIISRNLTNNKTKFDNTLKYSGTIQEINQSNIGINNGINFHKILKTKLDNTMNFPQASNLARNTNSRSKFNYENLLNHSKINQTNKNKNSLSKSKSPIIVNQNKYDNLNMKSFNILNTDSDQNDYNHISQQMPLNSEKSNKKSKSINILGKNQEQGNIINPELSISTTNKNSDQLIIENLKSKNIYIKSENEFLKSLINNPINIRPSNATFNSNFQNRLNIYSINSDYNSPHIIETDENAQILNIKPHEDYDIEVEKQTSEINNHNNQDENQYDYNTQEQDEYNTYEENEDLVNQQTPSNDNEEVLDKNEYLFFKKDNLHRKNELKSQQNTKSIIQPQLKEDFTSNRINFPNEASLIYSKNSNNNKKLFKNQNIINYESNVDCNYNTDNQGNSNSDHNILINDEEEGLDKKSSSNKNYRKKKNLDLTRLKNSIDIINHSKLKNHIINSNNINPGFENNVYNQNNSNNNKDLNDKNDSKFDLSLALKHRKSKDKVLFDNANNINNIQNKTLSDISSPKMNNLNYIFNSDKEINYSKIPQNQNLNSNTALLNSEKRLIQNNLKKKSSNSQLNTSDTSSYKFYEMKSKLKTKQFLVGNNNNNLINNLNNIKELNNLANNNQNLNNENDKYLLTSNTNEEDYSVSDIGFLSGSNKVDSNGVSRNNNRNKFINLEKNYLQTHMENCNNNLIKKYQNLNELGEILDDSNEKNLKSETKEDNNIRNSSSIVYFDNKLTQTSFEENQYSNSRAIKSNDCIIENDNINMNTENNDCEEDKKKKLLSFISDNEDYNENNKAQTNYGRISNLESANINRNICVNNYVENKVEVKKIPKLEIINCISHEFYGDIKTMNSEEMNKSYILANSAKVLDMISDENYFSDLRFIKLRKEFDQMHTENIRLISNESELLKTTEILKDYIKTQEKTFYERQKEDNSVNFYLQANLKSAENSKLKKEFDKMVKQNNELKLLILKMMHQINTFENKENRRYNDFFKIHNQLVKENEFLRSVCEHIVFAKQENHNLNQLDNNINSRNRNGNFSKTLTRGTMSGTIMKDTNSSVVHNASYVEENSFAFLESCKSYNDGKSIIIPDLNTSGILSESNSIANSLVGSINGNKDYNLDEKFSNFFSNSNKKTKKQRCNKNSETSNDQDADNIFLRKNKDMKNILIKSNKICYLKKNGLNVKKL